jgi:hypothetical protein
MNVPVTHLFLTRRNLLTLINKLDAVKHGESSRKTIIKHDTEHPAYPLLGSDAVIITAVEDDDYYTQRAPGPIKTFIRAV